MKGDFQVRFRENAGVKFPCVTRLYAILGQRSHQHCTVEKQEKIRLTYSRKKCNFAF